MQAGSEQAAAAGKALDEILSAVERVDSQISNIAGRSQVLKSSGDEMLAAITEARGIVETNREATQEMGATSAQVTEAVASIASVAEENSASTEQVSAAAEEMSAQVEEVNAASDQLGEMAESLQQQVDRFKLSEAAAGSGGAFGGPSGRLY